MTRPRLLAVGRACIAGAAALLGASLWTMSGHLSAVYAVATDGGAAVVVGILNPDTTPAAGSPLNGGNSKTLFGIRVPTGSQCSGDSANSVPAYLVQTYMVPSSVAPSSLRFDADGPTPLGTAASFRQPLYDKETAPYVSKFTAPASPAPGPGPVVNTDSTPFNFAVYAPGDIPAGVYNVGVACTTGPASDTQLDKFWNVQMTITTATPSTDNPAGIAWSVAASETNTSTSSSSTSTSSTTSSTSSSTSSTSSTIDTNSTTTSTRSDSATTTSATAGETTTTAGGFPVGELTRTGGAPWPFLGASALLLIFGRMVVLFARRPEVRAGDLD